MLLGRDAECACVDQSLADAQRALSNALLIRGEPGVGKTALFEFALERSGGMTVTSTRAIESESEIAFAGLADLLRPFLSWIPSLPASQEDALSGALHLGPARPGDPFAIYAATLGLLALAAGNGPILVAVDDAHWLDSSTQQALVFVARRMHFEGLAMVLTTRPARSGPLDSAEIPELIVGGLDLAASTQLLARQVGLEVSPSVAKNLFEATKGPPLALIECAGSLTPAQMRGAAELDDPLPIGPNLKDAFLRPIEDLSSAARRSLLILAASDRAEGAIIGRALTAAGISVETVMEAEAKMLSSSMAYRYDSDIRSVGRPFTTEQLRRNVALHTDGWPARSPTPATWKDELGTSPTQRCCQTKKSLLSWKRRP